MLASDESRAVRAYREERSMRAAISLLVIPFLMLLLSSVVQTSTQVEAEGKLSAADSALIGTWVFTVIGGCAVLLAVLFSLGLIDPKLGGITRKEYKRLLAKGKTNDRVVDADWINEDQSGSPTGTDLSDDAVRKAIDSQPTLSRQQARAYMFRHDLKTNGRTVPAWINDLADQVNSSEPTKRQLDNYRRIRLAKTMVRMDTIYDRATPTHIQALAEGRDRSGAYLDIHPKSMLSVFMFREKMASRQG